MDQGYWGYGGRLKEDRDAGAIVIIIPDNHISYSYPDSYTPPCFRIPITQLSDDEGKIPDCNDG